MTNTQLPKEVQEEIHNQAADHVQAHYGSFIYPSVLEDIFTDGASIYALQLQSLQAENLRLREALDIIQKWQLPTTGEFWDKEETQPMSFEAAYGSNGARDFMRNVANAALTALPTEGDKTNV